MARPPYLAGSYYHFYNRGARRISIFREDNNYIFVLRKLKKYCLEFRSTPIAYCLMPNHYHFLIRQESELSAGMLPQRIFNSYTKAYNKLYQHSGTLFEGHYQVLHVTDTAHLMHLCRYIHANPVKDGIVKELDDWGYSNYLEWVGKQSGTLVDRVFIKKYFPIPEQYAEFVMEYLHSWDFEDEI